MRHDKIPNDWDKRRLWVETLAARLRALAQYASDEVFLDYYPDGPDGPLCLVRDQVQTLATELAEAVGEEAT